MYWTTPLSETHSLTTRVNNTIFCIVRWILYAEYCTLNFAILQTTITSEQITKNLNFCFCHRILENYWQPLPYEQFVEKIIFKTYLISDNFLKSLLRFFIIFRRWNLESYKACAWQNWHSMYCMQLFTKEIVDLELNNDSELRVPVSNIPSDRLGNSIV